MHVGGLDSMWHSISSAAERGGDLVTGPGIITDGTKAEMREALAEIQDGTFARNFRAEYAGGMTTFQRLYAADHDHPPEVTGRRLRGMMPWLKARTPPTA